MNEEAKERKRAYMRKYQEDNRDRLNEYSKNFRMNRRDDVKVWRRTHRENNPKSVMVASAKRRAALSGVPFSITKDDFEVPEKCLLLGIVLKIGDGKPTDSSPSLDRIDNARGYVPGNVWVISHRANILKRDATADELFRLASNLKFLMFIKNPQ